MAGSVNKVILIGNLGRDPEIRSTQDGTRIANLNLATSESWKDRTSGERKDRVEWHRIVVFNPHLVEVAEKYLKKGSKIYVEGQLSTRKWTDNAGVEKYSTEVVLQKFRGEITMLESAGGNGGARDASAQRGEAYERPQERGGNGGGGSLRDELSDDIPFATNTLDSDILLARNRKRRACV